jgi:biopolymer transport protein ExbD
MMSTAFVAVYPGFSVALPQVSAAAEQNEQVVVWIGKNAQLAVEGQSVTKEQLASVLKAKSKGNLSVSIRADRDASHGTVVEIMDEIRKAGVTKMAIAIEEKV